MTIIFKLYAQNGLEVAQLRLGPSNGEEPAAPAAGMTSGRRDRIVAGAAAIGLAAMSKSGRVGDPAFCDAGGTSFIVIG
jgi:hypothetical protein